MKTFHVVIQKDWVIVGFQLILQSHTFAEKAKEEI